MYVLKNAWKCITRSKGRNILIGIIVLVIAVSACIGLSIRQASESAKNATLDTLNITATISIDRQAMMDKMKSDGGFDKSKFSSLMGEQTSLSLDDYKKYSTAESVNDFYYEKSVSVNGNDAFKPVTEEDTTTESESNTQTEHKSNGMFGGGFGNKMGVSGDFTLTGYSSDKAMTDFINGSSTIKDGKVFEEETESKDCIISDELATFNDLTVGNTITLVNPSKEDESYELNIVGIYSFTSTDSKGGFGMMNSTSTDPANQIYVSYTALDNIIENSESVKTVETDDNGTETSSALSGRLNATYVFKDSDKYHDFESEVRALGLSEDYSVSSADELAYEASMTPLNTLSQTAGYFLLVIIGIGAVILIVLNIFNIRERKYEIGVLTAIGMEKVKVAFQFLCETLIVTMIAVLIGAGIGAVTSVPVANALLKSQVQSQISSNESQIGNFGRGEMDPSNGLKGGGQSNQNNKLFGNGKNGSMSNITYISEIGSAMNFSVLLNLLGIGILLALISGIVSVLFVMRYEPLKILANRD